MDFAEYLIYVNVLCSGIASYFAVRSKAYKNIILKYALYYLLSSFAADFLNEILVRFSNNTLFVGNIWEIFKLTFVGLLALSASNKDIKYWRFILPLIGIIMVVSEGLYNQSAISDSIISISCIIFCVYYLFNFIESEKELNGTETTKFRLIVIFLILNCGQVFFVLSIDQIMSSRESFIFWTGFIILNIMANLALGLTLWRNHKLSLIN